MFRYLFVLLFFLPIILFGQTFQMSEEISIRNDNAYYLAGQLEKNFLIFRDQDESFEVQAFDDRMHLAWKKKIEFEKKATKILEVVPGKTSFSVIYYFRDKGKSVLKANTYDATANILDTATVVNYGKRFFIPKTKIIYSEDRSKFIAYHFEKQNEIEAYGFDLVDMKLLWQQKIKPDNMDYMQDLSSILVDNHCNMHIVVDRENRKSKLTDHHYEIFQMGPSFNAIQKINVLMEGKMTYDDHFSFDNKNNTLIATGLYSDKNRGKTNGYFFLQLPLGSTNGKEVKFVPFKDEFVKEVLGKEAKKNKGFPDTDIREIVHRTDGGILMIAERNREYEHGSLRGRAFPGSEIRNIVDYYYDDLIILSIHPDGNLHWDTILRKKQYSQDDDAMYSSYFLAKTPSSLRLLFNDDIRSENTVSEYVMKSDGEADRNSLLNTSDSNLQLRFRDAMQISSRDVVIPSQRKYKLKMVKLTF